MVRGARELVVGCRSSRRLSFWGSDASPGLLGQITEDLLGLICNEDTEEERASRVTCYTPLTQTLNQLFVTLIYRFSQKCVGIRCLLIRGMSDIQPYSRCAMFCRLLFSGPRCSAACSFAVCGVPPPAYSRHAMIFRRLPISVAQCYSAGQ